ncbi:MAG: adenosylcobinamide-phosphate synthase CbiB, partial [Halarsenatibacteraceae bacterium]
MIKINARIIILIGAIILDLLIGDPWERFHPIVLIGKLISWLESIVKPENSSKKRERFAGTILVLIVVAGSYFLTAGLIQLASSFDYRLGYLVSLIIFTHCLALKGLIRAGQEVKAELDAGNLTGARAAVNKIVGRDCSQVSQDDVIRATVESLAENTSDGILAPIFFFFIGGTPLAVAYKAVNTIDSMIGYRNEEYLHFGWAGAKFDDLWNFIPSRLTALAFIIGAFILGLNYQAAYKITLRDAAKHPSPNAGYPEA